MFRDDDLWVRCRPGSRLMAAVAKRADAEGAEVSIGLPERSPGRGVGRCTVLWCWVEGSEQVARAMRFRPRPSVVIRTSGSRRLLLWGLSQAIGYQFIAPFNRKLAYALRAPQKWAAPEALRIPWPGTSLRIGRARPVLVVVTRMNSDPLTWEQVVGRLREPPSRDAWKGRR